MCIFLQTSEPECEYFDGPSNGFVFTDPTTSFINGNIQTIACNSGFSVNGPVDITCTAIDENTAEWQPSPDASMCGKLKLVPVVISNLV